MVSRVGKFVGGFGADVTNITNVHATENKVAFGHGDTNPKGNLHVVGNTYIVAGGGSGSAGPSLFIDDLVVDMADHGGVSLLTPDDKTAYYAFGDATDHFVSSLHYNHDTETLTLFANNAAALTIQDAVGLLGIDLKTQNDGTIGSASKPDAVTFASDGKITLVDDLSVTGNAIVTLGIGAGGNTLPLSNSISIGNPANVIIQTASGSGKSIIVGDPTGTTTHSLDIRGSANVGALTATTGTYSGRLVVDDATDATSTTDGSLQTDGGLSVAKDAVFGDDIKLITDASVASFGVNGEITLTHVHNTGLLLEDSGGSPTLQLHDANESVSSDGSKLILTSNGVAFNLPTADGSAGQVLKTDGSRTLSFTDVTTDADPATSLASDTDCGALSGATSDTKDAFGIAVDDALTELDLKTQGANKLGTVDMGALS